MRRRPFIAALFSVATVPRLALGQNLARIGLLGIGSHDSRDLWTPVIEGLRDLGYQEGRNLVVVDRSQVDRYDALAAAASELAKTNLDVVICWGSAAPRAAMAAMPSTPIVLVGGDPVASGLAKNYARPGGNVTGIATLSIDIIGKVLDLLKETLPRVRRVAALFNPESPTEVRSFEQAGRDAQRLGLDLFRAEIRIAEDLERAIAGAAANKAQAMLLIPSTMLYVNRKKIAVLALKYHLPCAASNMEYAEAGLLLGYGTNRQKQMRDAARYVVRILNGESPADMAIERATQLDLAINMKTATALGVKVPDVVRFRTSRVIE